MNQPLNTNIPVLDSLRAFAALSVCLFHFVCTTTGFINTQWLLDTFYVGQYGVQLFFVISGFVIPWAMLHANYQLKNFFAFFLKRLARLEPPYLFSIALALPVLYLRANYMGKANDHMVVSGKQIALHIGYLIPFFEGYKWLNQVYWTLAIEFQYYLFIALIFIPLVKTHFAGRSILYLLILISSFFCQPAFLFYWLPVFLLGIVLFLFKAARISKSEYCIVTTAILCVCIYKYPIAAVVFAVIPLACVLFQDQLKIPILNYLGKFSYSIYLIHPILGASLINVLSHYVTNPLVKTLVIIAGITITLVAAYITYILIEKPSKKISAAIKY